MMYPMPSPPRVWKAIPTWGEREGEREGEGAGEGEGEGEGQGLESDARLVQDGAG